MTENERRLRTWIHEQAHSNADSAAGWRLLDAALSAARAEALDSVARLAEHRASLARRVYVGTDKAPMGEGAGAALETLASDILSGTAPTSIPVERAREVLRAVHEDPKRGDVSREVCETLARRLGVPLDAAQEYNEPAHDPSPHLCRGCDKPADGSEGHRFSCTVYGKRQLALPAKVKP